MLCCSCFQSFHEYFSRKGQFIKSYLKPGIKTVIVLVYMYTFIVE